eukprot:214272_1
MLSLLTSYWSFAPIDTTWMMIEKCLALINFCVFLSFHQQVIGLVGQHGLYPISTTIKLRKRTYQQNMRKSTLNKLDYIYLFLQNPTISLFSDTDSSLLYQCRFGMLVSLFIFFDYPWITFLLFITRICCWFIIFILSESLLINLGPFILQMEPMMNEINFLLTIGCSFPYLGIFLFRWFVARMMLSAGVVKWNGSSKWKELTALCVHYLTQPLPNYLSYFFHNLPVWFHKTTCWMTLFVEHPVCFLALGSFNCRLVAYVLFSGLLIVINISGNFGWLGLTSCIACFSLFDDTVFTWFDYRYKYTHDTTNGMYLCTESLFVIIAVVHWCCTWFPISHVIKIRNIKFLGIKRILSCFGDVFASISHLRIVNRYAMFAAMHDYRYEFVLQGSHDNIHWRNYEFKFKPHYNEFKPAPTTPIHWARLDWMIWFIPLRLARNLNHFAYGKYINARYSHNIPNWYTVLMEQLLVGNESILALLQSNPFHDTRPKYVRTAVYKYDIPSRDTSDGRWWIISGPMAYISTQSETLQENN